MNGESMMKSLTETCPICNGWGTNMEEVIHNSHVEEFEYECEECNGTGEVDKEEDVTA